MFRLASTVLLFAGLTAVATAAEGSGESGAADARLDQTFDRLGSGFVSAGRTDGLSIVIVKDGKPHFYNFGTRSLEHRQVPSEHTVYEIGSISKVFTSLLLAHAAVEGKVDLQDDVRKYLPGDYPNLHFQGTPVRLVDLVNTTSALPDNLPKLPPSIEQAEPDKVPFLIADLIAPYTKQDLLRDLKTIKLVGEPGLAPRHSNLAANLTAIVLEQVYGAPFEALLARYIEQPLGMKHGGVRSQPSEDAIGYSAKHVAMPAFDARLMQPSGGLRYSAAKMARFLQAQIAATDPAVKLSQKPAWGDPDRAAVGFNWLIDRTVDGKLRFRHSGGTFGFSSYVEMLPELGYGIVLLANRPGETQNELQGMAATALQEIFGKPASLAALEAELQASAYRNVSRSVAVVRRKHPELHLTEDYINAWGYRLLAENKPQMAVGLFRYNAEHWPESWNAFDSLAEAYERLGDNARAIENYRKSLELNPDNRNVAEHLEKLQALRK
jgi:CubicO group peptidase (beta-lactamase class C family)